MRQGDAWPSHQNRAGRELQGGRFHDQPGAEIETDLDIDDQAQQRTQQGEDQAEGDRIRYAEFAKKPALPFFFVRVI
jgi:hypothetical protein